MHLVFHLGSLTAALAFPFGPLGKEISAPDWSQIIWNRVFVRTGERFLWEQSRRKIHPGRNRKSLREEPRPGKDPTRASPHRAVLKADNLVRKVFSGLQYEERFLRREGAEPLKHSENYPFNRPKKKTI